MDATAWVAIAGIGGTLLAPTLTEWMHRKSDRIEQLRTNRLAVYADLLRVTARVADNAMTWSAIPLADLKESDSDELDRLVSQSRVIASDDVYRCFNEFSRQAGEFNRRLFRAKLHHQRVRNAGEIDDTETIRQRMSLGSVADRMTESYKQIEAVIRCEMKR